MAEKFVIALDIDAVSGRVIHRGYNYARLTLDRIHSFPAIPAPLDNTLDRRADKMPERVPNSPWFKLVQLIAPQSPIPPFFVE